MRVMLLADVKGIGNKGTVLEVKPGYARNFLLPKGLAKEVTPALERETAARTAREVSQAAKALRAAQEAASAIEGQSFIIRARSGAGGRLFGAITNADLARTLKDHGFVIDKRQIEMETAHHLGRYSATLRLYPKVDAHVSVQVLPADEA